MFENRVRNTSADGEASVAAESEPQWLRVIRFVFDPCASDDFEKQFNRILNELFID